MGNAIEPMCRLDNVEIVSSLAKICSSLYETFSRDLQKMLREGILRELDRDQYFLIVLIESSSVKVISEYHTYINKFGEQQYIKQLLNKKLPVILDVSVFDKDRLFGDIFIVDYSKLLDRVSNVPATNKTRMQNYIKRRRNAFSKTHKAVSMDEFLKVIRSKYTKHIEPL